MSKKLNREILMELSGKRGCEKIKKGEEMENWVSSKIEESNLDRDTIIKKFVSKFGKANMGIYNKVESQILNQGASWQKENQ